MNDLSAALSGKRGELLILLLASVVFLLTIVSPPSLMDDVDAFQAIMAKNMYQSGDWVTARVDGVAYFDKAPFKYWITVLLYYLFGVHDWVARIPSAMSAILLSWLVLRFGRWAFGDKAGLYAGLVISTCIGLFLFTRIIIPDVMLTLTFTVALSAFIRAQDRDEPHPHVGLFDGGVPRCRCPGQRVHRPRAARRHGLGPFDLFAPALADGNTEVGGACPPASFCFS